MWLRLLHSLCNHGATTLLEAHRSSEYGKHEAHIQIRRSAEELRGVTFEDSRRDLDHPHQDHERESTIHPCVMSSASVSPPRSGQEVLSDSSGLVTSSAVGLGLLTGLALSPNWKSARP
jgi:hypothetical protein